MKESIKNNYKVIYSDDAVVDLEEIEHYIIYRLKNPDAAFNTVEGILNVANSLVMFPKEHPLVSDYYLKKLGLRLVSYKNYNVLYIVLDKYYEVFIVRIFSDRRDWVSLLRGNVYPIK